MRIIMTIVIDSESNNDNCNSNGNDIQSDINIFNTDCNSAADSLSYCKYRQNINS